MYFTCSYLISHMIRSDVTLVIISVLKPIPNMIKRLAVVCYLVSALVSLKSFNGGISYPDMRVFLEHYSTVLRILHELIKTKY